ncbi:hypothetical protein JHK82_043602 [Glycine max]|nr:hypothetical protein JHK86_043489 [Glycine max]KAG5106632.1 hypothetical protein JHK82_043602 [Glycine max]KAG5117560.1 hypothetical protein JHK84_043673 [Glycine max]
MEMSNLASKLKTLKLELGEDLLVHLVLISFVAHFGQFKNKKRKKTKGAAEGSSQQKKPKKDEEFTCYFCNKFGHMKKECPKYATWHVKKDKKRHLICNFLVNSPKGTVFLYSLDTSDISKIANKVLKMLDFEKHLKVHQTIIKKGRRITTYIYGRTMLISIMKKFTNGRDLIRPSMTRFATTYLTLACLHELKASVMSMFSSEEWKKASLELHKRGEKVAAPLMVVLRLVDSDVKPTMGFIYEEMKNAKEKIKCNFNNTKKRPLHAAAYYLNPHLHYEPTFRHDDPQVKEGLHMCMKRLVKDVVERKNINLQLVEFLFARGLFSLEEAKDNRKIIQPGEWWKMFGDGTPELRRFAIRVLSLTCSSSGCERNWSSFEMVHTKRRNRLQQKKMNDLVYVMYNLKLKIDEIESDDEWITEEGYNDEDEQPQGEGDGGNVELVGDVGGSSNDLVVDAFDLDNLIFVEPNDDAQFEEDLDDDADSDESDYIHGDDPIRGLNMLL